MRLLTRLVNMVCFAAFLSLGDSCSVPRTLWTVIIISRGLLLQCPESKLWKSLRRTAIGPNMQSFLRLAHHCLPFLVFLICVCCSANSWITDNPLTQLPAGLFAGLTNLQLMWVFWDWQRRGPKINLQMPKCREVYASKRQNSSTIVYILYSFERVVSVFVFAAVTVALFDGVIPILMISIFVLPGELHLYWRHIFPSDSLMDLRSIPHEGMFIRWQIFKAPIPQQASLNWPIFL